VIVVLRNQFVTPALGALNQARKTAVLAAQSGILTDIRANGGTHVTSLISLNAVAAHLPAAEVQRLRANPDVALIEPDVHVPIIGRDPAPAATSSARVQPLAPRKHVGPKLCT
jgi:hypothetical protein